MDGIDFFGIALSTFLLGVVLGATFGIAFMSDSQRAEKERNHIEELVKQCQSLQGYYIKDTHVCMKFDGIINMTTKYGYSTDGVN